MTSNSLEAVAIRVAEVLGEHDYVLVGGLAVGAHGYIRATSDVDFVVRDLAEAGERLRERGLHFERLRGRFACLRGAIGDLRFDVLPPLVPIRWDLAISVSLGEGARIRVVDLDGLIRLKLKAGGPKDLMDVAALVLRHPEHRGRAREVAVAYRVAESLEVWLRDPRLKAELTEGAQTKRRRSEAPAGPAATRRVRKRST